MSNGIYISLGLYFLAMIGIGVYSFLTTKNDMSGFMLGGRQLSPAVTALSAGASDMSGWMLMGLPGAMYVGGLANAWVAIGLTIGAYANYRLVAPRLRVFTELMGDAVTIPEYFEKRFADDQHLIRMICAAVIIVFFAIYTTAGVVAGGKLFESSFGLDYELGLYITAGVVVLYTMFGGFLAVSTTDFVQGCIMFVALIVVPFVTISELGGVSSTLNLIDRIDPTLLSFSSGSALAVISALSWGVGYFGQPHIIVRFMAIRSVGDLVTARRIGMSWMVVALIGATMVGLTGAAHVKMSGGSITDPETIFIYLSTTLFHPLIGGFLLAAILAAIMSTISSQLLVASSSLTEDIFHTFVNKSASETQLVYVGRICVLAVAVLAVVLAHDRNSSILSLVSNAWAGFGAAFGPVILLSLFWKKMTRQGALAGIIAGAGTVLYWLYGGLIISGVPASSYLYEIVPGFIVGFCAIIFVSRLTEASTHVIDSFQKSEAAFQRAQSY